MEVDFFPFHNLRFHDNVIVNYIKLHITNSLYREKGYCNSDGYLVPSVPKKV